MKRRVIAVGIVSPLLLAMCIVGILLMIKPVRRRVLGLMKRVLYQNNSRAIATSFYVEALDLLDSRGMRRHRGQTPMEFAQSLKNHPAGNPFLALTRMYNAVRFGPPEAPFSRSEAQTLLHVLRQSLHSSSQSPVASSQ